MKLYFYILENNKIRFSECEVEEKPKSYTLKESVSGFYNRRVLKDEIGLKDKYSWKQIVILDKQDDELAKKYFCDYLNGKIAGKQKEIEKLQEAMEAVNERKAD